MTSFRYLAVDASGLRIRGAADAASEVDLAETLAAKGFRLVRARGKEARSDGGRLRLTRRDLIDFTHNLAMLETSGIPLFDGLGDLARNEPRAPARALLDELRADVGRGRRLSEAMARHARVFSPLYVSIVRAGEESGSLADVLRRLAEHLEWRESIRGAVRQMLAYPAILGLAISGLVVFLLTFLIPRLLGVYESAGVALPTPTLLLIASAKFLQTHGPLLAAALGGAIVAFVAVRRTPRGALALSAAALRVPKVGPVLRKTASAQFASTLATLYRAGVDLQGGLDLTAGVLPNRAMAASVRQASSAVLAGVSVAEAIRSTAAFHPLVVRMLAIGEKSGRLEEALDKVVAYYDRDVPAAVRRFLAIVEPTLTLLAGLVVGFVVLSAMLPIFKLFEAVRR